MTAVLVGGESDQLRALHDRHGPALWSYAVGLTGGDRGKAQDVVQETLLRAVRNLARLDHAGGSARAWLFTVAKRIVLDGVLLRRRQAHRHRRVAAGQPRPRSIHRPGTRTASRGHRAANRRPAPR